MIARHRYRNRTEAGRLLAEHVLHLKTQPDRLVLGIPRGGVVVAAPVARALSAPLDVLPARKLGAPGNPELAIGAVAGDMVYVDYALVAQLGITRGYVESELKRQRELSQRQARLLRGDRPLPIIAGKTIVLVDDGIATGATVHAALQALRLQEPRRLVVAVPVGPADSLDRLAEVADEVICPLRPAVFWAVGSFYDEFNQVSDEEVIAVLSEFVSPSPPPAEV